LELVHDEHLKGLAQLSVLLVFWEVLRVVASTTQQEEACRAFAESKGWTVVQVYCDAGVERDGKAAGVTGRAFNEDDRPELFRLLRDAEAGRFGAVVVRDLDRLGRNDTTTPLALLKLELAEVEVWTAEDGERYTKSVDDSDAEAQVVAFKRFMRGMQGAGTSKAISKNTKGELRSKAARGCATTKAPFGYTNEDLPGTVVVIEGKKKSDKRRVPKPEEAAVVVEVFTRYAAGDSPEAIAADLTKRGVPAPRDGNKLAKGRRAGWHTSAVRGMLRRSIYWGISTTGQTRVVTRKGKVIQEPVPEAEWKRTPTPWTKIVPDDLAARVEARREDTRTKYLAGRETGLHPERVRATRPGSWLLSGGLLVCSQCGSPAEARSQRMVYICRTSRRQPGACSNRIAIPIAAMDDAVLRSLEGDPLGPAAVEELASLAGKAPDHGRAHLEAEVARLDAAVKKIVGKVLADLVTDEEARPALQEARSALEKARRDLAALPTAPQDPEGLRAALAQKCADWKDKLRAAPVVARAAIKSLLEPITFGPGLVEEVPEFVKAAPGFRAPVAPGVEFSFTTTVRPEIIADGLVCKSLILNAVPDSHSRGRGWRRRPR
jgi:DNA invertase Pin-like site-specific DNA recombinase